MSKKDGNNSGVSSWKWRRVKAGLTLEDMAKLTDKHIPQLSLYESGKTVPKKETAGRIEKILKEHGV